MSLLSGPFSQLNFYLTRPAPCPYLPGQVEQKIFTQLSGKAEDDFLLNSTLSQNGFRRSQAMAYRPACPTCMACVPLRIVVNDFAPSASLRRILQRNADLTSAIVPVAEAGKLAGLFARYQQSRHPESDMATMQEADFLSMMQDGSANAFLFTLKEGEHTLAAMLVDRVHHGASAVYSYFEPNESARSLGNALILRLVDCVKAEGLEYLYLGYWIRDCRKMAYKARFPALERLGPDGWEAFTPLG
ncbi:MAG TPA: arginyltransferase [Alphaproteobacteria bacterium]|nr:arginyltransferase [Alphaproteobacteria bacterium]